MSCPPAPPPENARACCCGLELNRFLSRPLPAPPAKTKASWRWPRPRCSTDFWEIRVLRDHIREGCRALHERDKARNKRHPHHHGDGAGHGPQPAPRKSLLMQTPVLVLNASSEHINISPAPRAIALGTQRLGL